MACHFGQLVGRQGGGRTLQRVRDAQRGGVIARIEACLQQAHVPGMGAQEAPHQVEVFGGIAAHQAHAARDIEAGHGAEACQHGLVRSAGERRRCARQDRPATGFTRSSRRQPPQQGGVERTRIDRLGDKIVHARVLAGAPVVVEGIRGHRQNGGAAPFGQHADGSRGLQAVHVGHLHVHQDQVVRAGLRLGQRLDAIHRQVYGQANAVQKIERHLAIDRIVLRQQQPGALVVPPQFLLGVPGRHSVQQWRSLSALQPGREPEGAAHPQPAVGADFTTHEFRQASGDHQTEAGAAVTTRGRGVNLFEGMEQAREFIGCNAYPGIGDLEAHQEVLALFFEQPDAERNRAAFSELDRVTRIVDQRLAHAGLIAAQPARNIVAIELDAQALGLRRAGDHRTHMIQHRAQREISLFQAQSAGLDFREIEDVVDDGKQVLAGLVDLVQPLQLLGRGAGVQQMGQAQHRVHRRADLVAHVGKELALGAVGGFGGFLRNREFGRSTIHELFQVMAILFKLGLGLLALGDVADDCRGADDLPVAIADGRSRQGHRDHPPVLAQALGLEATGADAAPDSAKQPVLFLTAVTGNDHLDGLADHLPGGVAENLFRRMVPTGDDAVQRHTDDRIVGGFDDGNLEQLFLAQILFRRIELDALQRLVLQGAIGAQAGIDGHEYPVGRQFGLEPIAVDLVVGHDLALWCVAGLPGDEDDADHAVAHLLPHMAHQFEAGLLGFHDHVEQHQGDVRVRRQHGLGLFRRVGVEQLQGMPLDHHVLHREAQHGVDVGLVVDHQHLPGGSWSLTGPVGSLRLGREQGGKVGFGIQ